MDSVTIRVRGLSRNFGDVVAVDNVDLDVMAGEFLTLLGPSGSGKTTVLRMIAGFEKPDSGIIELDNVDVTQVPPYARDVNTVFQDYALFPHMSVLENVEYGLKVKKVSKDERTQRAREAFASVRLEGYENRAPSQLSGGQRQRVALARALVNRPKVLLLDEPLGALDLKLREEMQVELKEIQRQVGITFVFVTHDQDEALTMSDRIAVFNEGRIAQIGTPAQIYEHPTTAFVASFVGTSNLLDSATSQQVLGRPGMWAVRPEKIRVWIDGQTVPEGHHSLTGTVREVIYAGMSTRFVVDLPSGTSLLSVQQNSESTSDLGHLRGQQVRMSWDPIHEYEVS